MGAPTDQCEGGVALRKAEHLDPKPDARLQDQKDAALATRHASSREDDPLP